MRIDHQVASSINAFARYSFVDTDTFRPSPLPGLAEGSFNDAFGSNLNRSQGLALGATWIASPALFGEFRFGFARGNYFTYPPNVGIDAAAEFGLRNVPNDPAIVGGLPKMNIQGFDAVGRHTSTPQFQTPRSWNPRVTFTWSRQAHLLKFGVEFLHVQTQDQRPQRHHRPHELRGPLHRPRGRRSPARPALAAGAHQLHGDGPGAGHAVLLRAGRLPRHAEADAEPRAALRVRHAAAREEQPARQLRSGDRDDGVREGRRSLRSRAHPSRSEQLRAACWASRIRRPRGGSSAAPTARSTATPSDRVAKGCWASTRPIWSTTCCRRRSPEPPPSRRRRRSS